MELFTFTFPLAIAALLAASYTDLKAREVPDWLNYGLLFSAFGIRLIYASVFSDWIAVAYGIFGMAAAYIFSALMFYTGQWGGGDSKLLIGMGALFGLELRPGSFLLVYTVNIFVAGALYGIVWSLALAVKHKKRFLKSAKKSLLTPPVKHYKYLVFAVVFGLVVAVIFYGGIGIKLPLFLIAVFLYLGFYLWVFVKAVEDSCMLKYTPPEDLTEGDWIARNVFVRGRYICGPKDLGIERLQIRKLIKLRVKSVLVKQGIPFVPSFLFGLVITLLFGAWWAVFL